MLDIADEYNTLPEGKRKHLDTILEYFKRVEGMNLDWDDLLSLIEELVPGRLRYMCLIFLARSAVTKEQFVKTLEVCGSTNQYNAGAIQAIKRKIKKGHWTIADFQEVENNSVLYVLKECFPNV